jgi:hypothetical protein
MTMVKLSRAVTGKTIKVKSALQYDKEAPVFQIAKKLVTKTK